MMRIVPMLIFVVLTGCASEPTTQDLERQQDREATRRFNVCMKQTLGPLGAFQSPESRRKAAETCKAVMEAGRSS